MSFIDPLLALQGVDMQIWQLEEELKVLPKRKREEEIRLKDTLAGQVAFAASPDSALNNDVAETIAANIADIKAYILEIDGHKLQIDAEIANLKEKRSELSKNVRPEHLLIYDRLRGSRHPTIVKLSNGTCGGCH